MTIPQRTGVNPIQTAAPGDLGSHFQSSGAVQISTTGKRQALHLVKRRIDLEVWVKTQNYFGLLTPHLVIMYGSS